ncbi:hypothetical protein F5X99DRAFT_430637 [Biscogniauxia marginata]|nr:hypothetical protein F5X99DRAFT_430637 [Biscogniauxia marginata]
MPQDPNLYGQRPAKKQKKEIPLSSSLAFTSQLASLISSTSSSPAASASSGRSRASKSKDDIFSTKAKRKPGKGKGKEDHDDEPSSHNNKKLKLKDVRGTEEEKQDFARARRKMEEKARLYAAMKRGDYIAKENESAPLVDFDRKWAEKHPEDDEGGAAAGGRYSSSGSDNDSSDDDDDDHDTAAGAGTELIEYQDEFGRTRTGTLAEVTRLRRRQARVALGASELERMAARPAAPAPPNLIFGDAIQDAAFGPEAGAAARMASLAASRDRPPTPPADAHFDGAAEVRAKGVGFYQFSRGDAAARRAEMDALARERAGTESARRERGAAREKRRREIEERRRRIGERRAGRMADTFLEGLAGELGVGGGGGGGGGKGEESGRGGEGKGGGKGEGEGEGDGEGIRKREEGKET